MNLREPEKQILDDFEHKVTNKMQKYGDEPDFPKLENYGLTRMELDDFSPISFPLTEAEKAFDTFFTGEYLKVLINCNEDLAEL